MAKKRTNFIKELSWTEFKERSKKIDFVIIPTGAFEVYGEHLPLGTDTIVAEKIAEEIAKRVSSIIGPTLEVGDSKALEKFPGTITIRPESFKSYLWDTVKSLENWGYKKFLFMNTHAGNVPIITQISRDLQENHDIVCAQIDYWRFIQNHCEGIIESGKLAHGHASEAGTSVMLHLHPELCDLDYVINEQPRIQDNYPDIIQYVDFSHKTKTGTLGDATIATKEKGEQLVKRTVDRIVSFLKESWDLHEINR